MAGSTSGRFRRLDQAAMALSGLCLIHCVATALIVMLAVSVGGILLHPAIHEVGLMLATGLAAIALGHGIVRRRLILPGMIGGLGIGVMASAVMMPHGTIEMLFTVAGVTLVGIGHYLNRRGLA